MQPGRALYTLPAVGDHFGWIASYMYVTMLEVMPSERPLREP